MNNNDDKIKDISLERVEEDSYMSAILADEGEDLIKGILDRISTIEGMEVKDVINNFEEDVCYLKVNYKLLLSL